MFSTVFLLSYRKKTNIISVQGYHEISQGSSTTIFNLKHPTTITRCTSLPWLARISRQSPSLALTRLAWGWRGWRGASGGGRRGMPTLLQRPTLCSRNTYTREHVRERMYGRIHAYKLAAVASLEQGGIIRSATINPNDDDAVMTLSRTSFQATSVTLHAHLLLFSRSLHSLAHRLSLRPSSLRHTCLPLSWFLHLPVVSIFITISILGSLCRPLLFVLRSSCPTRSRQPSSILFKLLFSPLYHFEVGSYPVSTTFFPAREQFASTIKTYHCDIEPFVDIQ